jgi:hypothetical protein
MLIDSYKQILFFLWVTLFVFPIASHAISIKSYSYDKYGNLQEITDPRGFVTQFHYDLINRLVSSLQSSFAKLTYLLAPFAS